MSHGKDRRYRPSRIVHPSRQGTAYVAPKAMAARVCWQRKAQSALLMPSAASLAQGKLRSARHFDPHAGDRLSQLPPDRQHFPLVCAPQTCRWISLAPRSAAGQPAQAIDRAGRAKLISLGLVVTP
jgi:hypothetical protein